MKNLTRISEPLTQTRLAAYELLGRLASAFASPARLKIIQILAQSPRDVETLSRVTGESVANTSQHLQRLTREGVLKSERTGTSKIYSISNPSVLRVWESLQDLGDNVTAGLREHEDKLTDFSLKPDSGLDHILKEVNAGNALLIDVREEREFTSSAPEGSINIPIKLFASTPEIRKLKLPKKKKLYLFCRGRLCSMATPATLALRELGYEAYRITDSPFKLSLIKGGTHEHK